MDQPYQIEASSINWDSATKVAFRFFAIFFILSVFPFPLDIIPYIGDWARICYKWIWDPTVQWMGNHLLGVEGEIVEKMSGSGDKLYDWVSLFATTVVSALGCFAWSVMDRQRAAYPRFYEFLIIFLRYYLAFTLFGYGFAKVFHSQMPPPTMSRLMQPYGNSSPMGLLWTFVGLSKAYSAYTGWAEVLGGILLLFRRTTMIGALVTAVVMFNVMVLNYCFDVPVKIYSTLLCAMAIFIAAPDIKRLYDFFIRHRMVTSKTIVSFFSNRKWLIGATVLKVLLIGFTLYSNVFGYFEMDADEKPPLHGIYDVSSFSKNGQIVTPVLTDSTYWRKLMITWPGFASFRMANDSTRGFVFKVDTALHTIMMHPRKDTTLKTTLNYTVPIADELIINGVWKGDTIQAKLKRFDESKFLLTNRGFHWINEQPFNR